MGMFVGGTGEVMSVIGWCPWSVGLSSVWTSCALQLGFTGGAQKLRVLTVQQTGSREHR